MLLHTIVLFVVSTIVTLMVVALGLTVLIWRILRARHLLDRRDG